MHLIKKEKKPNKDLLKFLGITLHKTALRNNILKKYMLGICYSKDPLDIPPPRKIPINYLKNCSS